MASHMSTSSTSISIDSESFHWESLDSRKLIWRESNVILASIDESMALSAFPIGYSVFIQQLQCPIFPKPNEILNESLYIWAKLSTSFLNNISGK